MPVKDVEGAREALHGNEPGELLGVPECGWLDVKSGVYELNDPVKAEELAKDVAAFANAPTGGLLLVGFGTRVVNDAEIIDSLRPVPRALVDLDRHRKLIRERIIPAPRGLLVEWIDCGEDKGILVIDVPAQPPARLPHVVPGPTRTTKVSNTSVAIPIREADATHWLPQSEIQRILAAGWTATGGPSDEVLHSLVDKIAAALHHDRTSTPTIQVGQGEPAWAQRFQEVSAAVSRTVSLGVPTTEVYPHGPGVVQHFHAQGRTRWVVCALPQHLPIAVAEPVWQALQDTGHGAPGGASLAALGFPVLDRIDPAHRIIDAQATRVELAGGVWSPGVLVRAGIDQAWRWGPQPSLSSHTTRAGRNWTAGSTTPQLRVRAVASLPWAASDLAISAEARRKLRATLPYSTLAGAATLLSQHRGADLRAAQWEQSQHGQSRSSASYACTIVAPGGRPALTAEVMLALPHTMESAVVTCAELRVENVAGWRDALRATGGPQAGRGDLRVSVDELLAFFAAAWHTASELLPRVVVADPAGMPPAGIPVIELRLQAEHPHNTSADERLLLNDLVDFTPFGNPTRDQLTEMSVTITAPVQMNRVDRTRWTHAAVIRMAEDAGFVNASDAHL